MKEANKWSEEKALLQKRHTLKHWKQVIAQNRDAFDYDPHTVSAYDDSSNINGG